MSWIQRKSWPEALAVALVLLGGVSLVWFGRVLPLAQQVLLWGLLLIVLAVLLRRGWLKLFGPVLFYDLIRIARRGRYFLIRSLYGAFLAFQLFSVFFNWYVHYGTTIDVKQMANFAESFFLTFMAIQFAVVVLLTPAYTAGAIAEEKERKTLEFILATDLRSREIVLSKLAARLANLTLIVLTGLPILSFLQFLGGVDPGLVLAGFAATAATMLSLAALSILNSVLSRKARDAIVFTYLGAVAYLCLSGLSWLLIQPLGLGSVPSSRYWTSPVTVENLVEWFNAGNIFYALTHLFSWGRGGPRLNETLLETVGGYVIFHVVAALGCTGWAVLRLRERGLRQATEPAAGKPAAEKKLRGRPRVSDRPMIWKELYAEAGSRPSVFQRIILIILVLASFVPLAFIAADFLDRTSATRWDRFAQEVSVWVRIVATMVACLTLLGVAVRASGSVSSERDRQTLDALLTSPLDSNDILFGKWVGSILSVRWGWVWMGSILGIGVLTTGTNLLAVPLWIGAWFCYAAFLSSLGLWYSTVSRSTLRANVYTILTTLGVSCGHWFIWMCCMPLLFVGRGPDDSIKWLALFQTFALTPPATLGLLAFHGSEFPSAPYRNNEVYFMFVSALIGVFLYAVAASALWVAVCDRFRERTGRVATRPLVGEMPIVAALDESRPATQIDRQPPELPPDAIQERGRLP